MIVETKEEILNKYCDKELILIGSIVNKNIHHDSDLEEVRSLVVQLSRCRDTINNLSTLHGYSKAELEKEDDTLVFKANINRGKY